VVTYVLLSGTPPFEDENMQSLILKVVAAKYNFKSQEWSKISHQAKNFIKSLMQVNPDKRMSIE